MKYEKKTGDSLGLFVRDITITAVQDLSGTEHPRIKKTFDLYVSLSVNDGKFDSTMDVFGNLKRDGDKVEFGQAFKVGELFAAAGIQLDLDANLRIPADQLQQLVGKKIAVLKYIGKAKQTNTGVKPVWFTWDIVGEVGKTEALKSRFLTQAKAGKIRDYHPNAVEEFSTDFNPDDLSA